MHNGLFLILKGFGEGPSAFDGESFALYLVSSGLFGYLVSMRMHELF